jgi:hypothetical protein
MLLIRHAIGSCLFYQTENFDIVQNEKTWIISASIPDAQAKQIMKFKEELNLFVVGNNQKTWYYSSDAKIEYQENAYQLVVHADHKTVYPV